MQKFYTQPVTQRLNYGERNVVKLDTPQNLLSGELLVSVEVKVTEASQRITALDFGRAVKGSSDLLRLTTEPDFYSMGNLMEESTEVHLACHFITSYDCLGRKKRKSWKARDVSLYAVGV